MKYLLLLALSISVSALAGEINPYDSDIEEQLLENELFSERVPEVEIGTQKYSCYRETCPVYLEVDKSRQRAQLFVNGVPLRTGEWLTTTGMAGHVTPNFDRSPERPLRIYTRYTSSRYPGGDWNGLGNMPYAVFIRGGFAVHGTPSISGLGTRPLSHGCIRLHPLNGKYFNELVRMYGAAGTWIWVHD